MQIAIKQDFLKHYQSSHAAFTRYCASRAYGLLETEDLVQESVLIALESFEKIKDKERLLAYLIGIANNLVKRYARRQQFRANWDEQLIAKMESQLGDAELALEVHDLHRAIQALSDAQKEVILLFYISGLKIKEIASLQRSSEGAVKTRLSRARKHLRQLLSEESTKIALSKRLMAYAALF